MPLVRAPVPSSERRLPEALLLRNTPDGVLVRAAQVGRACGCSFGALTVDQIRNADPAACTVLPGGKAPAPTPQAQKPAPAASAERPEEATELLDDLLIALLKLPSDAWSDITLALPDQLYERIDQYLDAQLS